MCVATKRLELLISPRVQTVKVTLLFNQRANLSPYSTRTN